MAVGEDGNIRVRSLNFAAGGTEEMAAGRVVSPVRQSNVTVSHLADTVQNGREISVLDRERELATIERALAAAIAGNGRVLLVEGPAGIGKSTLLHAGSALARGRGVTVLSGRGSPLERQYSYGVIRQLYEPVGLADGTYDSDVLEGAAGLSLGLPLRCRRRSRSR